MFWIIVSILLLIAVAALIGWRFYLDRQWQRELRYFNRHENAPPLESGGEAKAVYGAKPNLNNSRHNRRDADESRAVYERTVEKLREVAPKRYRKLNAADAEGSPQTEHFHDLPIFPLRGLRKQMRRKRKKSTCRRKCSDGLSSGNCENGSNAWGRIRSGTGSRVAAGNACRGRSRVFRSSG